jgi:hypothetical protein
MPIHNLQYRLIVYSSLALTTALMYLTILLSSVCCRISKTERCLQRVWKETLLDVTLRYVYENPEHNKNLTTIAGKVGITTPNFLF